MPVASPLNPRSTVLDGRDLVRDLDRWSDAVVSARRSNAARCLRMSLKQGTTLRNGACSASTSSRTRRTGSASRTTSRTVSLRRPAARTSSRDRRRPRHPHRASHTARQSRSAPTSLSMPSRRRTSPRRAALTRHPGAPAAVSAARNGLGAPRPRLPRRLAAAGPWRCRARRDGTAGRRVRGSKTVLCLEGPDLLPALPRHFIHCSCFLFKAVLALPLPFQRLTRLILQAGSSQTNVREP